MLKILKFVVYFFIVLLSGNVSYANDGYKIAVKIDNKIISNHDIEKEKNYLSALNPKMLNIPEDEAKKIAKQSLIREIIKEKEVSKYYEIDYQSPDLIQLAKNLYTRLNINSEEEFKIYLTKYGLDLKDVLKKIAIETNWNTLIYQNYRDQISIDKKTIRKKLELENKTIKKEKLFLLSEIVFAAKNEDDYNVTYKKIIDNIKEKDFSSAATVFSLSNTAKFGGKIGWVGKNDLSEKIYKQISILEINNFTKPFKIGTGFMLLNLDDIKEEDKENNIEEQFKNIIIRKTNRQLNQFSNIFYKKLKKKKFYL